MEERKLILPQLSEALTHVADAQAADLEANAMRHSIAPAEVVSRAIKLPGKLLSSLVALRK